MSVNLVAYSLRETIVYHKSPELQKTIDKVINMMRDLGKEMDVLFTLIEDESEDYFSLSFSGCPLSLEFEPDAIVVSEYDESEGLIILQEFDNTDNGINAAVLWLINATQENQAN